MIFGTIGCKSTSSFRLSKEVEPFFLAGNPNLVNKISPNCFGEATLNSPFCLTL